MWGEYLPGAAWLPALIPQNRCTRVSMILHDSASNMPVGACSASQLLRLEQLQDVGKS